ncbi:unnamed protein product [Darwinula stevensoni]|uniref:Amiloride-sensitive sodium channel n=1 Tax=Darwinula stevensoni TaxID=69355 RepID=A0A7R9A8P0_9CRUS|nr:unnamed protein product [Darwinula stevensoni]CAG0896656.1 unnamed protein product [Darwinula stevensoni]
MGVLSRGDSLSQKFRSDLARRERLETELDELLRRNRTTIPQLLFSASLRCRDMVISCELGGESRVLDSEQCCSEIFLSRPLTSMGPCISTHGYTRYQNYPGASMGLSVMLKVFKSTWLDRSVLSDVAQADGYKVILTASYESPSLAAKMRAHSVNPGRKTLLGLQAVRVEHSGRNVYPVRSNACGDVNVTTAPSRPVHDLMNTFPHSWNCVERILRDAAVTSTCSCNPADTLSSAELENTSLLVCSPENYMRCIGQEKALDKYTEIVFSRAEKECKPLCTETSYEALVTYDHLNPAYVESVTNQFGYDLKQSEEVVMVGVHYNMLSERVITYTAFSVIDLISSTGGILGLIIGGSVLTVIQFIAFLLWLAQRLARWGSERIQASKRLKVTVVGATESPSASASEASGSPSSWRTLFLLEAKAGDKGFAMRDSLFI